MEDEEVPERAIAESSAALRSDYGARVSPDCGKKSSGGARLLVAAGKVTKWVVAAAQIDAPCNGGATLSGSGCFGRGQPQCLVQATPAQPSIEITLLCILYIAFLSTPQQAATVADGLCTQRRWHRETPSETLLWWGVGVLPLPHRSKHIDRLRAAADRHQLW